MAFLPHPLQHSSREEIIRLGIVLSREKNFAFEQFQPIGSLFHVKQVNRRK